jgi:hypothetical protein
LENTSELAAAFDAAITRAIECADAGLEADNGNSAAPQLRDLERELRAERERAKARGSVDREWLQRTLRWMVEWVPETELTLIAALGRIARVKPERS